MIETSSYPSLRLHRTMTCVAARPLRNDPSFPCRGAARVFVSLLTNEQYKVIVGNFIASKEAIPHAQLQIPTKVKKGGNVSGNKIKDVEARVAEVLDLHYEPFKSKNLVLSLGLLRIHGRKEIEE